MARADLLVDLVRSATRGDKVLFRRALEAVIAEERGKQHHVLADRLVQILQQNGGPRPEERLAAAITDDRLQTVVTERIPRRRLDELILPDFVAVACREFVEEQQRAQLLRSHNLEPRHRVLLVGPPGNGKTSLAEAIADALSLPLLSVRYDGVIGSYLGETAVRLRRLIDYVKTRQCVLFFDEFDTVGKERGDLHETGEIKRVVSSLLLQIDDLPSYVVIVAATNHPELLDRAVWRRFQIRMALPPPGHSETAAWVCRFEKRLGAELGAAITDRLAEELSGLSYAELEDFAGDVLRWRVLREIEGPRLTEIIAERLHRWKARAVPDGKRRT